MIHTWPDGIETIPNQALVYFRDGIQSITVTRFDPGDCFAPGIDTDAQHNIIPLLFAVRGDLQKHMVLEPGAKMIRWGVRTKYGPDYGHFYSRDDRDPVHLQIEIRRATPQTRQTVHGYETWLYFFMLGAERSFCACVDIRPFGLLGYEGQIEPAWCALNKLEGNKGIWAYHKFFMSNLHIPNTALNDSLPGRVIDLVKFTAPLESAVRPGTIGPATLGGDHG